MAQAFTRLGSLRTIAAFRAHLEKSGIELPVDDRVLSAAEGSPLAQPLTVGGFRIGNRWCIHPMEGWDGTPDGRPTEHTHRRWRRFGESGAKLIWGGEAFAVCHDGRANPCQLAYRPENVPGMRDLHDDLVTAHRTRFGPNAADDLLVGLQLTHSGRFSKPDDGDRPRSRQVGISRTQPRPRIAYHHPLLDPLFGIDPHDDSAVIRDDEIETIIDQYVIAAKMAQTIGFRFVDVKACHGYLGHEFLSAFNRPGRFGGDIRGRTRFLREIINRIRAECPDLLLGVRLSIFDTLPYRPPGVAASAQSPSGKRGPGIPMVYDFARHGPYPSFGCRRDNPTEIDLREPIQLLTMLRDELNVALVNLSAGSPYYNPHIQRPAGFPPSDGYLPPEDPLVGCARQIGVVRQLKQAVPGLPMVGTAYTYLQEWLPHVAQAVVRNGWVDFVGLGRMVLAYHDLPADCLEFGALRRPQSLCRTFSDCTTAPRHGMISGCYPLDAHYKQSPEHERLRQVKLGLPGRKD